MTDQIKDVLSRAAWTAAQAFLAVFTVEGGVVSAKAAAVAAIGALLSVLKTFTAQKVAERQDA